MNKRNPVFCSSFEKEQYWGKDSYYIKREEILDATLNDDRVSFKDGALRSFCMCRQTKLITSYQRLGRNKCYYFHKRKTLKDKGTDDSYVFFTVGWIITEWPSMACLKQVREFYYCENQNDNTQELFPFSED